MHTKNLLKFSMILSIFFAFNLTVLGQYQFGIKASGGLSRMTNSMEVSDATLTTPFVSSGQAGLFYSFQLGKKSSLGAELLFSQIEGKEKLEIDLYTLNGVGERNYLGYSADKTYRHISYLNLPVYYGFKINGLVINAGFQISYALSSSGRKKGYAIVEGITYTSNNKTHDINIKKIDFGPRAGITYNLTDKLAFEGTYYYGFNNIQKGNPILWKLKVQQATLGIRYTLWTKEIAKR
jgi:opacity protein-like surface antigen